MRIVYETNQWFVREAHCCVCGNWFEWSQVMAVVKAEDGSTDKSHVCPTCLEAGPYGMKQRALTAAQKRMDWAKADMEEATAFQAEEVIMPTPGDFETTKRQAYHEFFRDDVPYLLATDAQENEPFPPDPPMVAHSPVLLSRFSVSLLAPEWENHANVPMTVFREKGLSDSEYAAILEPLDSEDGYLRSAVDDTFTAAEVEILRKFFAAVKPTWKFSPSPATPIEQGHFGVGANAVGGPTDFVSWTNPAGKKGPEELPISAFVDLCAAESGPYVDKPWHGEPVGTNGQTVVLF